MRQLVQSFRSGDLRIIEGPRPMIAATEVLVQTSRSLVSAGTERAMRELASSTLLTKAKARPDLARQIMRKARTEGVLATAKTVRSRLDTDVPLGYSACGHVLEVGSAVDGVRPGDRVATGGAPHGDLQLVSGMLAVPVPPNVSDESAAFATVGAIALHGLRLAEISAGARIIVLGLGLVGQVAVRLARAAGCLVAGVDVRDWSVARTEGHAHLALKDVGDATTDAILQWSRGRGADAVLVTASTTDSSAIQRCPALLRDRGTIVAVGDIGLHLDRRPLYAKELQLRVSRSYGPGRYDHTYEHLGIDYPIGHVRWTERRNLEAVLDLVASGTLELDDLVTHEYPFHDAKAAYDLLESQAEPYLGIQLTYSPTRKYSPPLPRPAPRSTAPGVGFIGAGTFATGVLLPAFRAAGFDDFVGVCSASGVTAGRLVERGIFRRHFDSADALLDDASIGTVVIATPHASHADLTVRALEAGKNVFCEKPLALEDDELDAVEAAFYGSGAVLFVGFNRRFSPSMRAIMQDLPTPRSPLNISYRISAGRIPEGHWYTDRRNGGRILGEVCHFIDATSALVGARAASLFTLSTGCGEALLESEAVVLVRFVEGSLAAIHYTANASPSTPKEQIDIFGAGRTYSITDFVEARCGDRVMWKGKQDKGHYRLAQEFYAGVMSKTSKYSVDFLRSSKATIAAVESLLTGTMISGATRFSGERGF